MAEGRKTFMVEDAKLIFRNFQGKETPYNTQGNRNFTVILDPELAERMALDGWNVRYLEPKEEGDLPTPTIQVTVSFKNRPPQVTLITSQSRTILDEASIEVLDWADIQTCDLIANGYDWVVNGKTGTKAYLQTLFVTIEENALERKYAQYHDTDPTN